MSKIAPQVHKLLDKTCGDNVVTDTKGNRFNITLNRPDRSNSFTLDMYRTIGRAIRQANKNDRIKFIVLRGKGKNFSSGNDLMNFSNPDYLEFDVKEFVTFTAYDILEDYAKAIVESTKPIFAIVQGKIIGVAFTQLALFDKVFAVDGATLKAPLVKLSQGPEMASAYTFPKIFGQNLANELIIGAKEISAREAQKYGLLEVCSSVEDAEKRLQLYIEQLDELDWASYSESRKLMLHFQRPKILQANKLECTNLIERWMNPELPQAMIKYLQKIKKPSAKL